MTTVSSRSQRKLMAMGCLLCLAFVTLRGNWHQLQFSSSSSTLSWWTTAAPSRDGSVLLKQETSKNDAYECDFRQYDTTAPRFYGLTSPDYPESFLKSAMYLRGRPPILLWGNGAKLCRRPSTTPLLDPYLNETYQNKSTGEPAFRLLHHPVTDGTNPTLISLEEWRKIVEDALSGSNQSHLTTNNSNMARRQLDLLHSLADAFPTATYLTSLTFKNSHQCTYPSKKKIPRTLPGRNQPMEIDLLLVDAQYRTLAQSTILDVTKQTHDGDERRLHLHADDGKLMIHAGDGTLYLTHKRYGDGHMQDFFVTQLEMTLTMFNNNNNNNDNNKRWIVSATSQHGVCCGRNFMALSPSFKADDIENEDDHHHHLFFLTWPDPVWVQTIRIPNHPNNDNHDSSMLSTSWGAKPLLEPSPGPKLPGSKRRPSFHGTSGFLLQFGDEWLGVGHFHRERRWAKDKRTDARFGHHYTHVFFTISASSSSSSSSSSQYALRRVSQEFVFPTHVVRYNESVADADIIQYASGLEWVAGSDRSRIAIGYGINDCEAAVVEIDCTVVESMLITVPNGSDVRNLMQNWTQDVP